MTRFVLDLDDHVIQKAEKAAMDRNTTVAAMVRDFLESIGTQTGEDRASAVRRVLDSIDRLSRDMGPRHWTREGLYER